MILRVHVIGNMNDGYPYLMRRMFKLWRRRWLDRISIEINQIRDRLQFSKIERTRKYLHLWKRNGSKEKKNYLLSFLLRGKIAQRLLKKCLSSWRHIYTNTSVYRFAVQSAAVVHYRDIRSLNSIEQSV